MFARTAVLSFIILQFFVFLPQQTAFGWDISYEGDVMPDTVGWSAWSPSVPTDTSLSSSDGQVLHLVDTWTNKTVLFWRLPVPIGTRLRTMEARVRVASLQLSGWPGSYGLGMGVGSVGMSGFFGASIGLWPDKVGVYQRGLEGDEAWLYHAVDLTQWHTFRMGLSSDQDDYCRVWMDGVQIFSGVFRDAEGPACFGASAYSGTATSDSYWDYVRYSTEYIPVPEPSALLALAGGLSALGLPLIRRRK